MRPNLEQTLQKHYDLGPGLHQCFTIDEAEESKKKQDELQKNEERRKKTKNTETE